MASPSGVKVHSSAAQACRCACRGHVMRSARPPSTRRTVRRRPSPEQVASSRPSGLSSGKGLSLVMSPVRRPSLRCRCTSHSSTAVRPRRSVRTTNDRLSAPKRGSVSGASDGPNGFARARRRRTSHTVRPRSPTVTTSRPSSLTWARPSPAPGTAVVPARRPSRRSNRVTLSRAVTSAVRPSALSEVRASGVSRAAAPENTAFSRCAPAVRTASRVSGRSAMRQAATPRRIAVPGSVARSVRAMPARRRAWASAARRSAARFCCQARAPATAARHSSTASADSRARVRRAARVRVRTP